jgi:hypothetical protein
VHPEHAAHGQRVEPDRPHGDGHRHPLEGRADDGAARRQQHFLGDRRAALDGDALGQRLAGDEVVALADAAAVGADFLQKQVGVIEQPRGQAPGGEPVVPGREAGAADERGAADGPVRRADVGEIPVRRQDGRQVRVVGQQRPAGGRARRPQRPVVRAAAGRHQGGEGGQVRGQAIDRGAGLRPDGSRNRQPGRVDRIEGGQRLGAVFEKDFQTGQLRIPVGGQREGLQLDQGEHIDGGPGGRPAAQQDELVRPPRQPPGGTGADPGRVRRQHAPEVGVEHAELLPGRPEEADPPRQPIDRQPALADPLRQSAADDAQQHFQLKGPVLAVAEAEAEPGVVVVVGLDAGNAPAVAADQHGSPDAGHLEGAVDPGQPPTEQSTKEVAEEVQRRRSWTGRACAGLPD